MHAEPHEDGGQYQTTPTPEATERAAQDGGRDQRRGISDRRERARQQSRSARHEISTSRTTCQEIRTTPEARQDQRRRISCRRDQPSGDTCRAARANISAPNNLPAEDGGGIFCQAQRQRHEEKPAPILPRAAKHGSTAGQDQDGSTRSPCQDQSQRRGGATCHQKRRQPRRISQRQPRTADEIRTSRTTCRGSTTGAAAGNLPAATAPKNLPQDQRGKPAAGNPETLYNKNNSI